MYVCVWVTPWARQWKLCIFHETSLKMDGRRQRREVRDEGEEDKQAKAIHSFRVNWGFVVAVILTPSIWTIGIIGVCVSMLCKPCTYLVIRPCHMYYHLIATA